MGDNLNELCILTEKDTALSQLQVVSKRNVAKYWTKLILLQLFAIMQSALR